MESRKEPITKQKTIAANLGEFTEKSISAITGGLNETQEGKQIMQALLDSALARNPALSPEEWQKIKQSFLVFMFHELMACHPDLMQEMGTHVYNELREGQ